MISKDKVLKIIDNANKLLLNPNKLQKISKEKLIKIKESADKLLTKLELDEKNKFTNIINSSNNTNKLLNEVLDKLQKSETQKDELIKVIIESKQDFKPLFDSINDLVYYTKQKSDIGIINAIDSLNRNLLKLETKQGKDRTDEIIKSIKEIKLETGEIEFPESIAINNFPPQKIPQPVTHISINSLSGNVHQTSTTVSSILTSLPGYGVLSNRRAIIFYNNDSNNTVYIGSSTVTPSNGLPIEPKSFSPSFDSGPLQVWYGITSSGTADIRTIEIPDENSGK